MNNAYRAIRDRLLEEMDYLEWIDVWKRQIDFLTEEHPIAFPACFIEFLPIPWSTYTASSQKAVAVVRVHVFVPLYYDTHGADGDFNELDVSTMIFNALHGYKHQQLGTMKRIRTFFDTGYEKFIDVQEDYEVKLFQCVSMEKVRKKIEGSVVSKIN